MLDLPTPPSAIFVINNPMALGALTAIRERGLRVPRDISVIAFDDAPWSALLDPPLTTIAQPTDMLGTAAARLLLARIEGQYAGPAQHIVLPPRLIERASTDRAPAAGAVVCTSRGRSRTERSSWCRLV